MEFYAPWCEACTAFSPFLEQAVVELRESHASLQHIRVDGDSLDSLRARFKVLEAPGLLLIPALPRGARHESADAAVTRYDGALETAAVVTWAAQELGRVDASFAADEPPSPAPSRSPSSRERT